MSTADLNETQTGYLNELELIANKYFEQADFDDLKNSGYKVEIYFDTFYILAMIQGYWELQTRYHQIDYTIFDNDQFLVKALAFYGYIKDIKILNPHLAELSQQLKKTYLLPETDITIEEVNDFLQAIDFKDIETLKEYHSKNELGEYLENMSHNAEKIFKANYILAELRWHKRSNRLFKKEDPIITYDRQRVESMKIIESRLFNQILNAISTGDREDLTINNFRDAMSLCIIKEKIKEIKNDSGIIPIFYVTHDILSRLDEEIKKEFTFRKKDKRYNLLKDTEFFIIDAIFNKTQDTEQQDANERIIFNRLKHIRESFNLFKHINIPFPPGEMEPLISNWNKYRNHDFFQRIWKEEQGGELTLHETIKSLINYDFVIDNKTEFTPLVETERDAKRQEWDDMVYEWTFLEVLWTGIKPMPEEVGHLINKNSQRVSEGTTDVFRDEALTRFSPPTGYVEERIKEIWNGFITPHKNHNEDHRLKVALTKYIYEGVLKTIGEYNYDKILIGISILYVFHKYELIIKIVEKLNNQYGTCYQIALIYTASMVKDAKQQKVLNFMDEQISKFERHPNYHNNYKLWIAIGYIKFNIWHTLAKEKKNIEPAYQQHIKEKYLKDSIYLMKKANEYLSKTRDADQDKLIGRNTKYYYTLNSYIYYLVESKDTEQFNSEAFHENYVKILEDVQTHNLYRFYAQSRFADTIARYYFEKSKISRSDLVKEEFLVDAERYIKMAIETMVLTDERFNTLKGMIVVELENVRKRLTKDQPNS
jgi:hypothetical protein